MEAISAKLIDTNMLTSTHIGQYDDIECAIVMPATGTYWYYPLSLYFVYILAN